MLEVLVPATHRRLTSIERVEMVSGLQLQTYWPIEVASRAVETYLGRVLSAEMVRETFLASASSWTLRLTRWPIMNVLSVVEDGRTIDASGYDVEPDAGLLRRRVGNRNASWLQGVRTVVEYAAGYTCGDIRPLSSAELEAGLWALPSDIEIAVIGLIVAQQAAFADTRPIRRVQAGGSGGIDVEFAAAMAGTSDMMPANVKAMLAPYRTPRI